jgi:hypothetical protein
MLVKVNRSLLTGVVILTGALLSNAQAFEGNAVGSSAKPVTIRVRMGADCAAQLGFAWGEAYHRAKPNVDFRLFGSNGAGFHTLATGSADIVLTDRAITPAEADRIKTGWR